MTHTVCDAVIDTIADRVQNSEAEPDFDNFENLFQLIPPSSGNNSAGSSPSASPSRFRPSSGMITSFPQPLPEDDSELDQF